MHKTHALVLALCAAGVLALAILVACGKAPESDSKPPVPAQPAKPPAYVRPKLSSTALWESEYYPLDTCVVSGKKLLPHSNYEDISGRLVRTYNQHQVPELLKDPEKYLALIDGAYKAKQTEGYPLTICVATGEPLPERPVEVIVDMRQDFAKSLQRILRDRQKDVDYRYTLAGRLLRFKDEAALASFKAINADGRMPVAELAMDRYVTAMVRKLRAEYLKTDFCPVNKKTTGRPEVDPKTGGYRNYLLGPKLYIVCCATCLVDMDEKFQVMVEGAAAFQALEEQRKVTPEQHNILILKKMPDPPDDK